MGFIYVGDNVVDVTQIQAVTYSDPVESDADFKYHPQGIIILKSGDKINITEDSEVLRSKIESASKDSEEYLSEFRDLGRDLIYKLEYLVSELEALRAFHQRFVFSVEDYLDKLRS